VESTPYPYPFGHFLHLEIFTPYVQPLDLELTDISIVTHTKKKKKKKKTVLYKRRFKNGD
jgi:hypothetical protein